MTDIPFPDELPSQLLDDWDPFEILRTLDANPAQVDAAYPLPNQTPKGNEHDTALFQQQRPRSGKLALLQVTDWVQERTYDEDPPICIHYSTEWKVTVNGKVVSKDTEQDLVLAPGPYWDLFLRPKLNKPLRRKLSHSKCIKPDDTNVVVSVTERSERDLTKRFDDTEVDWLVVERQLSAWGKLFRTGKRLRVDLSFNYVEIGPQSAALSKKGDKRGSMSVTQQMRSLTGLRSSMPSRIPQGNLRSGGRFTI